VHGSGGSSGDWGAPTENRTDSIPKDSIVPGSSYSHFLNDFMLPYVWFYDTTGIDTSFTKPGDPAYPNKTFLEVINFDYNTGSVDAEGPGGWSPHIAQIGQEAELRQRIEEVLEEYYGPNWQDDTSAKVILVCHSMGTASSRYAVTQGPSLASHIKDIVTIGGMHKGVTFMDEIPVGEFWVAERFYWLPFDVPMWFLTDPSKWHFVVLCWKSCLGNLGLDFLISSI
jgi:hypothetical protein